MQKAEVVWRGRFWKAILRKRGECRVTEKTKLHSALKGKLLEFSFEMRMLCTYGDNSITGNFA